MMRLFFSKRVSIHTQQLTREEVQERRSSTTCPAPSLPGFAQQPVQPLEAHIRKPCGRPLESLCFVVNRSAQWQKQLDARQSTAILNYQFLLTPATQTDDEHRRARCVDVVD